MFSLSSADSFSAVSSRLRTRRKATGFLGAALLLAYVITQAGCGNKSTAAPPPAPIAVEPPAEAAERPAGPAWEPQNQEKLPPPQAIPSEAVSDASPPLQVTRSEPTVEVEAGLPRESPPAPSQGVDTTTEPSVNSPAPFRLGVILSAEERAQYNKMIDRDLALAEKSLARVLSGGRLQERSAQVKRVRAFMRQAEEVRRDDLPLAKNLAGRARLLAEDLAGAKP